MRATAMVRTNSNPSTLAEGCPGASVAAPAIVAAPYAAVADLDHQMGHDVLVCSDHPRATEVALAIAGSVDGLRALDTGMLSNAAAIETFTSVLLTLNRRYKARVGIRVTGLDET